MENKFPQRLTKILKEKDMLQIDLAKSLGIRKQKVSDWCNGKIQPDIEMILRIATVLNETTDYLLGKTE